MRFAPYLLGLSLLAGTAAGQTIAPDEELPGDFDGDGEVGTDDVGDVNALLTAWNNSGPHAPGSALFSDGDMDRDGDVDTDDVMLVTTNLFATRTGEVTGGGPNSLAPIDGVSVTAGTPGTLTFPSTVSAVAPMTHTNSVALLRDEVVWSANGPGTKYAHPNHPALQPTVTATWYDDGVDLTYTWNNSTLKAKSWGHLHIPIFDGGGALCDTSVDHFEYRLPNKNIGRIGRNTGSSEFIPSGVYPQDAYSPVFIVRDNINQFEAGISMQAPVLEYNFETGLYLNRSNVNDHTAYFSPNSYNENLQGQPADRYWHLGGLIPADGEDYVITVSVRVRSFECSTTSIEPETSGEWLRTLRPYRQYFRNRHGGTVAYTRDPEPVSTTNLASNGTVSFANPRGFNLGADPNIPGNPTNGANPHYNSDNFGALALDLAIDATGSIGYLPWSRVMISAPSGKFEYTDGSGSTKELAFPPLPCTGWYDNGPEAINGVSDPVVLSVFGSGFGTTLGVWWGNSMKLPLNSDGVYAWHEEDIQDDVFPFDNVDEHNGDVMPLSDLDPTDSYHITLMQNELDFAEDAIVTEVGLDAFAYLTPAERFQWLRRMQIEYPGIRFIVEPNKGDLMQRYSPGFVQVYDDDGTEKNTEPPVLADFLLPGHEFWGNVTLGRYEKWYNYVYLGISRTIKKGDPGWTNISDAAIPAVMEDIADDGYIPAWSSWWNHGDLKPDRPITLTDADEGWLDTVPSDLQY